MLYLPKRGEQSNREASRMVAEMSKYSLYELERMDTIYSGKFADMKLDNGEERVWLSRMTKEEGAKCNNKVTVEVFKGGIWTCVDEYEAV